VAALQRAFRAKHAHDVTYFRPRPPDPKHADCSAAELRCRATFAALQRALKPQHADIVTRLYGLDGAPPQQQQAVAVSERVSKARIYQIKEVSVPSAQHTGFREVCRNAILQRWRAAGAAASRSETRSSNAASVLALHVPHSSLKQLPRPPQSDENSFTGGSRRIGSMRRLRLTRHAPVLWKTLWIRSETTRLTACSWQINR